MAGSVNKVILIGNLGRDPESRSFANGGKAVKFSLATSENWGLATASGRSAPNGTMSSFTTTSSATSPSVSCARAPRSTSKGRCNIAEYDDANGQKQKIAEVVLQRFRGALTLLDRAEGGGRSDFGDDTGGYAGNSSGGSSRPQSRPQPAFDTDLDDDVPF